MGNTAQALWDTLADEFSAVAEATGKFVVSVHGGHRVGASGIIWRPDLVVTTSHTLRRTDALEVSFHDKSTASAKFIGRDAGTDVAVLRLSRPGSSAPDKLTDSGKLRVGQLVLSVGRSRMKDLSASAGIIARVGDGWETWRGGRIDSLVRPDITLYPGLSGSALVNSRGQLLGMNTAALARAATITIPSATIERVVTEIVEHGGVFRPYLGLAMQPVALPEDQARDLNAGSQAALMVMQVEPGSPSADAGLLLGDLVLSFNSEPVAGIDDVQQRLRRAKRGDSVEVGYARAGQHMTAKVKLAERPGR
ncbi:MAG: trypsin-like peptidase domain-containing protein [Acidobacteria bacterium]|nr:trypsin-like peptidase domain-containing protein [Acidobacteriota bacterium]MBV9145772.1 trypsin-like peptidase domain-containing protein [Acidobacteriota bacterium]MBV9437088.1 trypsin-like peptidase domain-containing protein [Acidobacteriota bacterium]